MRWPFVRRSTYEDLARRHLALHEASMEQLARHREFAAQFNVWLAKYHPDVAEQVSRAHNVINIRDWKNHD